MSSRDDRALVGALVFLVMLALASIYLIVASGVFGALENSPITNDPSFSDPDAMIDGSGMWATAKVIGLQGVPLLLVASGLVFAVGYYIRRERTAGRRRPPL